jgi:hypothetical protein
MVPDFVIFGPVFVGAVGFLGGEEDGADRDIPALKLAFGCGVV